MNVGMTLVQMKFWRGFMNVGTASVRINVDVASWQKWSVDVTSWLHECWHGFNTNEVLSWLHGKDECWHDFSKCWHSFMAKMNVGTALVQMEFWRGFMNVGTALVQMKCWHGFMTKINVGITSVLMKCSTLAWLQCKWNFDMAQWKY